MTQLASRLDCQLYMMETQQIVTPNVDHLLPRLAKSTAVEFAGAPKQFMERLSRKNAN